MVRCVLCMSIFVILPAFGCGLGDYERRAETQRLRLKQFDEDNRYLAGPIEPPWTKVTDPVTKKEGDAMVWPFDVFVRPFEGTWRQADEMTYAFNNLALYRYPDTRRDGFSLLVAAAHINEPDKNGQFKPGEFSADEFRHRVRGALAAYCRKAYGLEVAFPNAAPRRVIHKPFALPGQNVADLEFSLLEYDAHPALKDATCFFVHFFERAHRQVALIYQAPLRYKTDANVTRAMELSLKSLEVDASALEKRNAYERMNTNKKK